MLPVASIYVDSLGPLYHELELRIQLATTDRAHPRHTREQIGKDGDWSLTSYLRNKPRLEYFGFTVLPMKQPTRETASEKIGCAGKSKPRPVILFRIPVGVL